MTGRTDTSLLEEHDNKQVYFIADLRMDKVSFGTVGPVGESKVVMFRVTHYDFYLEDLLTRDPDLAGSHIVEVPEELYRVSDIRYVVTENDLKKRKTK